MSPLKKLANLTLVSCYLLILAGATVRTTGAGLGCPDWPKCFGRWVPPTAESELPPDYRESFVVAGRKIAPFDPIKTWSEYINRLLGLVVGLEMILLVVFSFGQRTMGLSLTLLTLTILQGLLGARVVTSGLEGKTVALHLLLALLILLLLHFLLELLSPRRHPLTSIKPLGVLLILGLLQFFLGILVRQEGTPGHPPLGNHLGPAFWAHRAHALLLLGVHFFLCFRTWGQILFRPLLILGIPLLFSASLGVALAIWPVPALLGAFHLLAACLYVGGLFSLYCGSSLDRDSGTRVASGA